MTLACCMKNGLRRVTVDTGQTLVGPCHNQVRNIGGWDSGSHRRNGDMDVGGIIIYRKNQKNSKTVIGC